ncbi:hypothetical protein BC829DRAFT_419406 [Chytridium lagenaria]|nr:hypothetical protein BC829DRAFT_419406 [Chytridium lagenaria]
MGMDIQCPFCKETGYDMVACDGISIGYQEDKRQATSSHQHSSIHTAFVPSRNVRKAGREFCDIFKHVHNGVTRQMKAAGKELGLLLNVYWDNAPRFMAFILRDEIWTPAEIAALRTLLKVSVVTIILPVGDKCLQELERWEQLDVQEKLTLIDDLRQNVPSVGNLLFEVIVVGNNTYLPEEFIKLAQWLRKRRNVVESQHSRHPVADPKTTEHGDYVNKNWQKVPFTFYLKYGNVHDISTLDLQTIYLQQLKRGQRKLTFVLNITTGRGRLNQ